MQGHRQQKICTQDRRQGGTAAGRQETDAVRVSGAVSMLPFGLKKSRKGELLEDTLTTSTQRAASGRAVQYAAQPEGRLIPGMQAAAEAVTKPARRRGAGRRRRTARRTIARTKNTLCVCPEHRSCPPRCIRTAEWRRERRSCRTLLAMLRTIRFS